APHRRVITGFSGSRAIRHVDLRCTRVYTCLNHCWELLTVGFQFGIPGAEMSFTDKFRQQHDEILAIVGELNDKLKAKADAQALRSVLSNLAGKLNFHLAMEDKALYPRILKLDGKAQ